MPTTLCHNFKAPPDGDCHCTLCTPGSVCSLFAVHSAAFAAAHHHSRRHCESQCTRTACCCCEVPSHPSTHPKAHSQTQHTIMQQQLTELSSLLQPLGLSHLVEQQQQHILHPGQRRTQLLQALVQRSVASSQTCIHSTVFIYQQAFPQAGSSPTCQRAPRRLLGGKSLDVACADADQHEGLPEDERFARSECMRLKSAQRKLQLLRCPADAVVVLHGCRVPVCPGDAWHQHDTRADPGKGTSLPQ